MSFSFPIPPGTQRVFIAVPVDPGSQAKIDSLLVSVRDLRDKVFWIPRENRHLTLAFLGNTPATGVERLLQAMDETYRQEQRFTFGFPDLKRFPGPRGRIVALTAEAGGQMSRLFRLTRRLLREQGLEFDRKGFRPHVTLGRIKKPGLLDTRLDRTAGIDLDVAEIILYRSVSDGTGTTYTPLKTVPLRPPAEIPQPRPG